MLIMLVLVVGYLVCVSGGTSFVNMDLALAIFPVPLKPVKDGCHSKALVAFAGINVKQRNTILGLCNWIYFIIMLCNLLKDKGWASDVTHLAKVTQFQLHAASSEGSGSQWSLVFQILPHLCSHLKMSFVVYLYLP